MGTKQDEVKGTIQARLRGACVGHPHAKIPWPHYLLHEAANELDAKQREIDNLKDLMRGVSRQLAIMVNQGGIV